MNRLMWAMPVVAAALGANVQGANPTFTFKTAYGDIVVELLADDAPVTVENFLRYVSGERYGDRMFFHRLARYENGNPFVLQGGGFQFTDAGGLKEVQEFDPIPNEFKAENSNVLGTLSMARLGGDQDSARGQFFFNLSNNTQLDDDFTIPGTGDGYCVFGRVISGSAVLKTIRGLETVDFFDPSDPVTDALRETPVNAGYQAGDDMSESALVYAGPMDFRWATERASIGADEQQGNAGSTLGSVSNDGELIAFWSIASNLVKDDTNAKNDVFVRNRGAGWTSRVSVSTAGVQGNGTSDNADISGNGRFVVFSSDATNLINGDTNGKRDIFIRDRVAGTTARISVSLGGGLANGHSDWARVSDDGRFVVFESDATNLVAGDTNGKTDVFLRDRQSAQTFRVSVNSQGVQGNGRSFGGSVSNDGLSVAFTSLANNLVPGDTNGVTDVFFRNRQQNATVRASVSSIEAQGNKASGLARISGNGRYIAFTSAATNLVGGDTNNAEDVFRRDRYNFGTTARASLGPAQAQANKACRVADVSADGRYILFTSEASNLVASDTNAVNDAFRADMAGPATVRVSIGRFSQQANQPCIGTSLSGNGKFTIFNSSAGNLVYGDTEGLSDVFIRRQ
jgi:cyclophilin family peptidyl-prolyl cis-trans isomerase